MTLVQKEELIVWLNAIALIIMLLSGLMLVDLNDTGAEHHPGVAASISGSRG